MIVRTPFCIRSEIDLKQAAKDLAYSQKKSHWPDCIAPDWVKKFAEFDNETMEHTAIIIVTKWIVEEYAKD